MTKPAFPHLWFMYLVISLYLLVPILRVYFAHERLATMSESERERFIAREFRVKALTYAVMWGLFAGDALHLGTDPTTSAKYS